MAHALKLRRLAASAMALLLAVAAIPALSPAAGAVPVAHAAPTGAGTQYTITESTGSMVPGTTDTGNHVDDGTTGIQLPFAFTLYNTTYPAGSTVHVSSNGNLQFTGSRRDFSPNGLPEPLFQSTIFAYYTDLVTYFCAGECQAGIFTSVSGTAPNRTFNIEWRAGYCCNRNYANFEIVLHENSSTFDLIYGTIGNSLSSTEEPYEIGVQQDQQNYTLYASDAQSGGSGDLQPNVLIVSPDVPAGTKLTFTLGGTTTSAPARPTLTVTAPSLIASYGQPIPALTPTYSGFAGSDTAASLAQQPTCTTTATQGSAPGAYPVTCSGGAGAYTFVYQLGTLTITQAALTVTAPSFTLSYGQPVPEIDPIVSGLVHGDAQTVIPYLHCSTDVAMGSPVGAYPVTCSGGAPSGYSVTYVPSTITVVRGNLTVSPISTTKFTGAPNPPISARIDGLYVGDSETNVSVGLTCSTTAVDSSPVGPYPITCTGLDPDNYTVITETGTLRVSYKILPVTPATPNSEDGATIQFQIASADGTNMSSSSIVVRAVTLDKGLPVPAKTLTFSYGDASSSYLLALDGHLTPGKHWLAFDVAGDPIRHHIAFIVP